MRTVPKLIIVALCLLWSASAHAVAVEKVVSPGGIVAWLVQDHSNPIVSLSLAFRGGAALVPDDKAGLASMTVALLDEGAGDMDSQTYQARLRDLSVSLGFSAGQDALYGRMKTLTDHLDEAFGLLSLALTEPRFDRQAVERIRSQMLTDLTRQIQDPNAMAQRAFAKLVYGSHPYGRAAEGVPGTIEAIDIPDLQAFAKTRLARDVLYVAVAGDITPERLGPLLDRTFGGLPAAAQPAALEQANVLTDGRVEIIRRPIPQSVVVFGQEGIGRDDPDWYAAYVMNYILGGDGLNSRLMTEIRVKRGLSYGVYSFLAPKERGALIEGTVSSANDRVAQSLRLIREEWAHMAENGVTEAELADAKTYLLGSFPLQMDSTQSISALLIAIQLDRLGIDYLDRRAELISGVTKGDIGRVARRLLDAGKLSAVIVGDPEGF